MEVKSYRDLIVWQRAMCIETQIDLVVRLSIIPVMETHDLFCLCRDVGKMLHGLVKVLPQH